MPVLNFLEIYFLATNSVNISNYTRVRPTTTARARGRSSRDPSDCMLNSNSQLQASDSISISNNLLSIAVASNDRQLCTTTANLNISGESGGDIDVSVDPNSSISAITNIDNYVSVFIVFFYPFYISEALHYFFLFF